jgi:predicted RNA methylase
MPLHDIDGYVVELEVAEGLEEIALNELLSRYRERLVTRPIMETGCIRFGYVGNLGGLLALDTILSAYLLETYDIPRPKAFLGHAHFTKLTQQIETARSLSAHDAYTTITINAAGSDSSVMRRLLDELAIATRLEANPYEGDLLVRLRRAAHGNGWDALVRLSPRPNATRDWRVVNVPGALNASVARAMALLSDPSPEDTVLNVACGSGSLAIERALVGKAEKIMACDNDLDMVEMALQNIAAAKLDDVIEVRAWDAGELPLPTGSVDVALADLPFGHRVGSHADNRELYPDLFREVARVVKRDGVFVAITHEIKLMEAVLLAVKKWEVEREIKITLSGLHPRIYVLRRI